MAIVSKAQFEKEVGSGARVGAVYASAHYRSTHAALDPLADGGALFLVTVRPPDERLWLVAVLESPRLGEDGWRSLPNTTPIAEITQLKDKLKFVSGAGITARPGALGMSLQTPRRLSDDDVRLLRAAAGLAAAGAAPSVSAAEPSSASTSSEPSAKQTVEQAPEPSPGRPVKQPAKSRGQTAKGAAPSIVEWGVVTHAPLPTWPPPVWASAEAGLLVVARSATSLSVHRLAPGLPVATELELPKELAFVRKPQGGYDSPWERSGTQALAVRPDGGALALVGDNVATLLDLQGNVLARWTTDDVVLHTVQFGARGRTLWVGLHGDAFDVLALDGSTLAERGRLTVTGDFPDPAWITPHPHLDDDVAAFEIACGQDGWWLKVFELDGARVRVRKQKLSSKGTPTPIHGLWRDQVATSLEKKLLMRSWPSLEPVKGKVLGGINCGGVLLTRSSSDEEAFVVVAVGAGYTEPTALQVYRIPSPERVATLPFPVGEKLLDTLPGVLATQANGAIRIFGLA